MSSVSIEALAALKEAYVTLLDKSCVVGSALRVVTADAVPLSVNYGVKRVESGACVDDSTIFHWASVTKVLTGIAVLQLRDQGRLALSDPVTRHLPELRRVHNEYGSMEDITLWHLCTHSGGFRAASWPWKGEDGCVHAWHPFEPTEWSQIVAMLPYTAIQFPPGSVSRYSNLGILFLGRVVEVVTGEPYVSYVTSRILYPLGMTRSYFDVTPPAWRDDRCSSYLVTPNRGHPRYHVATALPFDPSTGITVSNSGLNAPLDDVAKLVAFLCGACHDDVLSQTAVDEMCAVLLPVALDQVEGGSQRIGLIMFNETHDGVTLSGHSGDQNGFTCQVYVQRGAQRGYVAAYNSQAVGEQSGEGVLTETAVNVELRAACCKLWFVEA